MSNTAEDVHPGPPEPSSEDDLTERQRKVVQAIRGSIGHCCVVPSLNSVEA